MRDVMLRMRKRERTSLAWYSPHRLWDFLLYVFVGNGYHPEWALAWSILIVGIGVIVFRPHKMVLQKPEYEGRDYGAVWYSLDLFTPAIDLETAKVWMPRHGAVIGPFSLRLWMRFHRILGWIIIPIGLLALTGIISRD
jgi:hypothetical protein